MKRIFQPWLLLLLFVLSFTKLSAQVDVTATIGTPNQSYTTLSAAFSAINAGTHKGSISIGISGNTTETGFAILNASGSGAASYSSVAINPTGGAARTISGNLGFPMIDLNGADNVTIDGLNTGGNSLTIVNTNASASTIRFINDASYNTIQNCTVLGSTTNANGTIFFSTGVVTGNDRNTISGCTIDSAVTGTPRVAIFNSGTSNSIQNDSISINNNNIANFYNAAQAASGIVDSMGASSMSITGNRFYQSVARTATATNVYNVIYLRSGASQLVSNNRIGFANAAGIGMYTITGSAPTRFVAIHVDVTSASIQGNTISNISLSTSSGVSTGSGVFCGINIVSGNVNVGTVTGNIIGAASGNDLITTSIQTSLALMTGVSVSSATGFTNIRNNTIGGLTCTSPTSGISGALTAINVEGQLDSISIANNTIGSMDGDNLRAGNIGNSASHTVSGISLQATGNSFTVTGNTIRNLTAYGNGTAGYVRAIWTTTAAPTAFYNISNNNISELATYSRLSSIANGYCSAAGIILATGSNSIVTHNYVISIVNRINTNNPSFVAGISLANGADPTVSSNQVYNMGNFGTATSTSAPSEAAGIVIGTGSGIVHIHNNMISLGIGQPANTAYIGIHARHASGGNPAADYVYHNTINIEGEVTSGAQPSFGFYRGDFLNSRDITIDFRNNIVTNKRTGGTGKHFAIANDYGAVANVTGWPANASNYNVLTTGNPNTLGYWGADQNFAGWKTVSAGDASSFSGVTVNYGSNTWDLHLNMGTTPTLLESNGQPIAGINTDIDSQVRPGPTGSVNGGAKAPDIGADEFDGVQIDPVPPVISYTALPFTCSSSNRVLTATIVDPNGSIPASGIGLPVLYWKKNNGTYTAAQGVYTGNNHYDFTFGAGAVLGDSVSYYIVAQDNTVTPNVVVMPSAGAAGLSSNPPATATPPSNPSLYKVNVLNAGTYSIGTGGNYSTLGAAVNAYNNSCLTGPVVFNLTDATYPSENLPVTINHNWTASSTNTLTIRPAAGVAVTLSGSSANAAVLKLNGADYVTIDGINTGGTSLLVKNTNASGNSAVIWIASAGAGDSATNNTIKNCTITGAGYFTTFAGIASGGTSSITGQASSSNSNNVITGNTFTTTQHGILINGSDLLDQNWMISNNYFGSNNDAEKLVVDGTQISNAKNFTINNNIVSGIQVPGYSSIVPSGIRIGGIIDGGIISKNKIGYIRQLKTFGVESNGIELSATSTNSNITVVNNFVYDVYSTGGELNFLSYEEAGNCMTVNSGGGYNIYSNSLMMSGPATYKSWSCVLKVGAAVTTPGTINLVNNIMINLRPDGVAKHVLRIYVPNVFGTIDYNDYFSTSNAMGYGGNQGSGGLQGIQNAFGGDLHSINILPGFIAQNNLHLIITDCSVNGRGIPLPGINTDIDGESRDANAPDMGADEYTAYYPSMAVPTTGADSSTRNVSATGTDYTGSACGIITRLVPAGASPLAGSVKAKVKVDAAVQTYNGSPYVQRHYDIEPANNPSTSDATVTLYFKQSEFDSFNVARGIYPALPTGPADAAGIANLRVTQYHGSGTAPTDYTGTVAQIDPDDANIVWDVMYNRWQLSFSVTGFSGFYVQTATIYSFTGNGNWSDPANWANNLIPPANLLSTQQVFIDPPVNGECVLDVQQTISLPGQLIIRQNKKFRIPGNLIIQ